MFKIMFTDEENRKIFRVLEEAQIKVKGYLVTNFWDFVKFINKSDLSEGGKGVAFMQLLLQRDIQNLIRSEKKKICKCPDCNRWCYAYLTCEKCVGYYLKDRTWTSKNEGLDKAIREAQKKVSFPNLLIEWIPFEDLTNLERLVEGKEIFSAIWTKGFPCGFRENQLIRVEDARVCLKELPENADLEEV
jgi:hypothetical protein